MRTVLSLTLVFFVLSAVSPSGAAAYALADPPAPAQDPARGAPLVEPILDPETGSPKVVEVLGGAAIKTAPGQGIPDGSIINTEANDSATVTLPDGSSVIVGPLSRVQLTAVSDPARGSWTEFQLMMGSLTARTQVIKTRTSEMIFAIRTPTADVEVTGTTLSVQFDPSTSTTDVAVTEGTVQVTPRNPQIPAFTLTGGQKAEVTETDAVASLIGDKSAVITPGAAGSPQEAAPYTAEKEMNNRFSQANSIGAAGSVAGTIDPIGDHDWYRLTADSAGELHVTVTDVAAELSIVVQVWDGNKDVVQGWQGPAAAGADTDFRVALPRAGEYWLEVTQSSDNAASAKPYRIALEFTATNDTSEPNNRFAAATALTPGGEVSGHVFPTGDHDWYRLRVDTPGELHVTVTDVAAALSIAVQVWDGNRDVVQGWQGPAAAGADTDFRVALPRAGEYWLEVTQSSDNAASVEPYRLLTEFSPADDVGETNDRFGQATRLQAGTELAAQIFPTGDHDWYRIETPGRARMYVVVTDVPAELDVVVQVWNASRDLLLGWQGPTRPGADTVFTFDLAAAGAYYLEVGDSSDNQRSAEPYTLLVTLSPAVDALERNDRFVDAEAIAIGASIEGSILPPGDHDWFAVDAPTPGSLGVEITHNPADLDVVAQVWNADKELVCGWQGPPRAGADTVFNCDVKEAGHYYLEVADGSDNQSAPEAYHLTVTFSAS